MNIPRYKPNPLWIGMPIVDDKEGKLCEYRDYVKLEAENARIKADVKRLRKAGDEILNGWQSNSGSDVERFTKAYSLWITAKEGKQS